MTYMILLKLTGTNTAGQSARLFSALGELDARILDVGHSVIHNQMLQVMMLQFSEPAARQDIVQQLGSVAKSLQLTIDIADVSAK